VDGSTTGEIGPGAVVLVGIGANDNEQAARQLANKVAELRIFEDDAGKMNRSLVETGGAVLVISQFTLYGDCRKGRRPSFDAAGPPELARNLYEKLIAFLQERGLPVQQGVFQAMMQVELVNDGPVTILLDTDKTF
jgi:D-tyrosyl-tRNA(Tyr) deacylase